jgi:hypothetical protein
MSKNKSPKHYRHYIDKKLLFRLRLYLAIFFALLLFISIDSWRNTVAWYIGVGGGVVGIVVGILISRMSKLSFDKNEQKVISQFDRLGVIILIAYLGFVMVRNTIFGNFIHGASLSVFTLSITAGSMLGRVIITRYGIIDLLEAANIHYEY